MGTATWVSPSESEDTHALERSIPSLGVQLSSPKFRKTRPWTRAVLALLPQGTRCHAQVPVEQGEGRLQGWGCPQGSVREGSSVGLGRGSESDLKALPRGQRQSCPQLPRWSPWGPCREDSRAGCGWRQETLPLPKP